MHKASNGQHKLPFIPTEKNTKLRGLKEAETTLGPIHNWPQPLLFVINIILNSPPQPMLTVWGQENTTIYNNEFAKLLGAKDTKAFGKAFSEETNLGILSSNIEAGYAGKASQTEQVYVLSHRNEHVEETYFNFSFVPLAEEDGKINGVLGTGIEVTGNIINQRRQSILYDLSRKLSRANSPKEVIKSSVAMLKSYQNDIPFLILYKTGPPGQAQMISSTGLRSESALYQQLIDQNNRTNSWPVWQAMEKQGAVRVDDLEHRFGAFQCGPYPENPKAAYVLPVSINNQPDASYMMVAGISAHLQPDKDYQLFYEQLSLNIGSAIKHLTTKEAYHKSEIRYRSIVNNTAVGIAQVTHGQITYANNRACEITGKSRDQLIGRMIKDLIHPDDHKEMLPLLEAFYKQGKAFEIEKQLVRPDGKLVWIFNSITPVFDKNGSVIAASVASIDISKQKKIEDSLRKSKSKLSALFSKATVGISEISTDGKFIRVNKELCRIFGRSRKELLSLTIADVTHKEDLHKSYKALNTLLQKGGQVSFDKRYIHPDGSIVYTDSTLTLLGKSQHHHQTVLVVTVDITSRKRHEQNAQLLSDINSDLASLSNPNEIMEATAEKINRYFNLTDVIFADINESGTYATVIYDQHMSGKKAATGTYTFADYMSETFINRLKAGEIVVIEDANNSSPTASSPKEWPDAGSQLHSPYLSDGRWKFLISLLRAEPYQWKKDELELVRDLTARIYLRLERVHAEKALKDSEIRLKKILETPTVAVIFFKQEILIDANKTFLKLTGYSDEEVQKNNFSWRDLTPPEFIEISEHQLELLKNTGKLGPYEKEYYCKDGSRIWFLFAGSELDDGTIVEFCVDISERKEAEKQLLKSEERYKTLFNSMDEGFAIIEMIFDEQGKPVDYCFVETNPAFEKQTGLKNATGKRMKELIPDHEEHWFETYGEIALTGKPKRFTNAAKALIGGWYEVYAFPYGEKGSKNVGVIFNNISRRIENEEARRRSEEHLQRIMESAKDYAILTVDKKNKITSWNAGAENLFGYTHDEVIGKGGEILFIASEREWAPKRELQTAASTGNAENERWHIHKNGYRFWGSGLMMPLLDEKGHPRGFLKILRDNTEKQNMQKALQQAKEREIELIKAENRRKDEFMSIASHELKTPLTSLQAYIQLLAETSGKLDQETLSNYINKLDKSSQRIANLVRELLDASRIKSGKIKYNFEQFEFGKMVEECIEMARHYTNKHDIIQVGEVNEFIYGDKERLQQVINNLLSNAIKYSPEGGKIYVYIASDAEKWRLAVTDPGIGIPEDKLNSIFKSYNRVDTGLQISGMGLGLYISAEIIKRHEGRLWAESKLGKGSAFIFTIPKNRKHEIT